MFTENDLQKALARGNFADQAYYAGHTKFLEFSNDDDVRSAHYFQEAIGFKLELKKLVVYPRSHPQELHAFVELMDNKVFKIDELIFDGYQKGLLDEFDYVIKTNAKSIKFFERCKFCVDTKIFDSSFRSRC